MYNWKRTFIQGTCTVVQGSLLVKDLKIVGLVIKT